MAKIDYKTIEKEYMTSAATLNELAKKYSVSHAQLYKRAKKENWEQIRETKREKQKVSLIEKTMAAQEDAWEKTKASMLRILEKKLKVLEETPEKSDMTYGQIGHTIKEMRECGMFGATTSEKKLMAEIDKLKKEIDSDNIDKEIIVRIEGGGDYGN